MSEDPGGLPRRQRVAAYAVIVRAGEVLLSRLAPSISEEELWTLPGGGIEFGEHPDDAVVREVHEETGLDCHLGRPLWIGSAHRVVDRESAPTEMHSVRIVYDAWVAADAPEPRVVEVDGSTVDARWLPVEDVESGVVPTVPMVREALAHHRPAERQRLAAYALVRRDDAVLLTRNSPRGPRPGTWTLPGGGLDHGEPPAVAVAREVVEETGLVATVGRPARRARRALHRHRAARSRGGLPRRPPRLRGRGERRASRRSTTSTAPPTPSRGSRWPRSTSGAVPVSTLVTAALDMDAAR